MATPIAIAVVEQENRFLIGQRPPGVPLAGFWEFPGGKIEPGETPEQAAVRECLEETNIRVEAAFRYSPQNERYEHGEVALHFIACRPLPANAQPQGRFRWVERHELAYYDFPAGNRRLIEQLLAPTSK